LKDLAYFDHTYKTVSGQMTDSDKDNNFTRYFSTLFPTSALFDFYSVYCGERPENREFCLEAEDWRRRFEGVDSSHKLASLVKTKGLRALHAGAIYSDRVSFARRSGVVTQHKELLFDLDLQDNSWVAGEKNDMVHNDRFMPLLFASANILKVVLEQVFGFSQFMLVYSGRRGVHLYTLDSRAFKLTSEARKAICAFVSLPPRATTAASDTSPFLNANLNPSLNITEVHDAVDAAWTVATGTGDGMCNMLSSRVDIMKFAHLFCSWRDFEPRKKQAKDENSDTNNRPPPRKLPTAQNVIAELSQCSAEERLPRLARLNPYAARDLALSIVWPRLDAEVTSSLQHTIKTPFSLHAATQRVALPLGVDACLRGWKPSNANLWAPEFENGYRNGVDILKKAALEMRRRQSLEKKRGREENTCEASW
jgi:DNA primase small subunit